MKIKQAEKRLIFRSEITLAPYNPRKISEEARRKLKANLKRIGLLGGIVWNETTGNLVSGHQKLQIIDELERYNAETHDNDYQITVEVVNLTEKEEKEQNIFMNSTTVQGEFDNDLLADIIKSIDYDLAGLDQNDLNLIMADSPLFNISDFNAAKDDFKLLEQKTDEEREIERQKKIEQVKAAKQATKNKMQETAEDDDAFIVVSFSNFENKTLFMETIGASIEDKYIKGETLLEMLQ